MHRTEAPIVSRIRYTALGMVGVFWLCLSPVLGSLLLHGVTWKGRMAGLGVTLSLAGIALLLLRWAQTRFSPVRWRLACASAVALGVLLLLPLPFTAPAGTGGDAALRVEHVYLDSGGRFPRYSVANLVPEVDQVVAGIDVMRVLDSRINGRRARRIGALMRPAYGRMAADPAFGDMGSVMSYAYAEVRGGAFDAGHYLAVVPRRVAPGTPWLLFLHGNAGPFAIYGHVLSPLAREHGIPVICPSFGFGNWQRGNGPAAALAVARDACRRFSLDPRVMSVVGLSASGPGVTRLVAAHPEVFRRTAFLSGSMEPDAIARGIEKGAWDGVAVLVIHGAEDERIPFDRVNTMSVSLEGAGAHVARVTFPGEDHFLFLSQEQRVLSILARWMGAPL